MLKEELKAGRIAFSSTTDWETAMRTAARPLLEDGCIEPCYADSIIHNVRAPGGTYMDLGFGITLAHARPEAGALSTAISILVLDPGVNLNDDPDHPTRVIVMLAARDADQHRQTMAELAAVLIDEERRNRLLAAHSPTDVLEVFSTEHA
ncbi:PTS sugar transporter subunit IIA [Actinomyces qiguomingii]|uniref:PTS sugar transporter subunit IIA n=1 Tax=Actinomyces qiguomingii TaxID=2057800 RepID=UPI000CA01079|nr:PTS sugar transporter subunit IIA [Actinomyces qiguomingii]